MGQSGGSRHRDDGNRLAIGRPYRSNSNTRWRGIYLGTLVALDTLHEADLAMVSGGDRLAWTVRSRRKLPKHAPKASEN